MALLPCHFGPLRVCHCSSVWSYSYSVMVLKKSFALLAVHFFFSNPVSSDSCSYYQANPLTFGLTSIDVHIKSSLLRFPLFSPQGRPQSSLPSRPSPWRWHCLRLWRGGQQAVERQYRPDAGRRDRAPDPEASRHSGTISSAGWAPCRNSSVDHITKQDYYAYALY